MKIIRFKNNNFQGFGRLEDEAIIPFIKGCNPFNSDLSDESFDKSISYKLNDCELLKPVVPSKVIGIALNYPGVSDNKPTQEPLVFIKGQNSVVRSNTEVKLPNKLPTWGEAELALIVGKKAEGIIPDQAAQNYILGFCVANDITCDNTEGRDHHLAISKSQDGFCPIGSFIETNYEYENKTIRGYQNGELIREGNSSDMIYKIPEIISYLSGYITLLPGDIILTGSPKRVREKMYLSKNDTYTVVIEGLEEIHTKFR